MIGGRESVAFTIRVTALWEDRHQVYSALYRPKNYSSRIMHGAYIVTACMHSAYSLGCMFSIEKNTNHSLKFTHVFGAWLSRTATAMSTPRETGVFTSIEAAALNTDNKTGACAFRCIQTTYFKLCIEDDRKGEGTGWILHNILHSCLWLHSEWLHEE